MIENTCMSFKSYFLLPDLFNIYLAYVCSNSGCGLNDFAFELELFGEETRLEELVHIIGGKITGVVLKLLQWDLNLNLFSLLNSSRILLV